MRLADFQAAFAHAVTQGDDGFAIYHHTVMRGCIDALEANYPAVACLVGRGCFRAASAEFVARSPPYDSRLVAYGEGFATFLEGFGPAAGLPYLADVARLDRLWTESFMAVDAPALDAAMLRGLAPEALAGRRLRVHPATRSLGSASPVFAIWQASHAGVAVDDDLAWQPVSVLVTRPSLAVDVVPVSPGALVFIEACADGAPLAEAAARVCASCPDTRLDLLLAGLLQAGAFTASEKESP